MTTFQLVRHAQKSGPPDLLAGRGPDVPLSAEGRAQAEALAAALARGPADRILASPRARAQATAAPFAARLGRKVGTVVALDEMDFGDWTGRTATALAAEPDFARFNRHRSLVGAPGGETMLAVQARVVGLMLRWQERLPAGNLVLFTHAEPIRAALLYFAGLPLDHWSAFDPPPASISTVIIGHDRAVVLPPRAAGLDAAA